MASPEIIESSGALDSSFQEELSAPEGWKKKLMMKKAGTPKKKDVVYVAPDGEEIKSKRQLEKYLKAHPGGPSPTDFDWTTGGMPRRSARLSSKGRISGEGGEAEPVAKRSKTDVDEETVVVSPRKASKRRSGSGKDEVMEDAGKGEEEHLTGADGSGELSKEGGSAGDAKDENNTAEGGEKEAVGEVKLGEPAKEEVPFTGDKVMEGEPVVSKDEELLSVTDVLMEEPTVEDVVVTPPVEVVKPATEGETSLKEVEGVVTNEEAAVVVPGTEKLDGKDDGHFKSKEQIEPQGIHVLIEDPVLSGVTKTPEQPTEPSSLPGVRIST